MGMEPNRTRIDRMLRELQVDVGAALLGLLVATLGLSAQAVAAAPAETGVVLMHGKSGSPDVTIDRLAAALREAGYKVSTPLLPWSRSRIYDASVEDALAEIDREVAGLREVGARRIVIAGQSLGGNVAIRYAAKRKDLAAVIALAPAHNPDSATARRLFSKDLERARGLIAAGHGERKESFLDADARGTFPVVVTPAQYVSWWGEEDGDLLMPRNAANIQGGVPLLYVVGSGDSLTRPASEVFEKAPAHPYSRYVVVDARHTEVPTAAREVVLGWLASLR